MNSFTSAIFLVIAVGEVGGKSNPTKNEKLTKGIVLSPKSKIVLNGFQHS